MPKLNSKLNKIKKDYATNFFKRRKYFIIKSNDTLFIRYFFIICIYLMMTYFIQKNHYSVDVLVLILGYFTTNVIYTNKLIEITSAIREVSVSVRRVKDILYYENREKITYGQYDNDYIDGIIEFRNVSFSYKEKKIINKLNLKIMPNQITAIVGVSGCGKTTIIDLLLRLRKLSSGNIYIDNVDIYNYTEDIYASNIAVVNQNPFLFNMSIRKNLSMIDSNINNQIEACKRVRIHDFIMSLPKGYNTILRENATNVSGGQKQLISLARVLLSKAEILLLDDITAALDPDTIKTIINLLVDLKQDHTIIMITHKPELMKKANRIIVLDEGKIVGDGKHRELVEDNKYYQWLQTRKSASRIGVFDND